MSELDTLIPASLADTIAKLAQIEGDTIEHMAADDAYNALDREPAFQIYTLHEIAKRASIEPWAAQVAADWLRENDL